MAGFDPQAGVYDPCCSLVLFSSIPYHAFMGLGAPRVAAESAVVFSWSTKQDGPPWGPLFQT